MWTKPWNTFRAPTLYGGLLTGNYPDAAITKLHTASIYQEFSFGAFGEFHSDRNMLPKLALKHIQDSLGVAPDPSVSSSLEILREI